MEEVPLIRPWLTYSDVAADLQEIFASGVFTQGAHAAALRTELAAYTTAHHAFLTTSATTALWLCMRLLKIGNGDEVIVSDFSFPATANVVEDVGARPVFADVSLETFNMLPVEVERRISHRTKAVIFVDALGNPSGLTDVLAICQQYGLTLIEDAACAIGSRIDGRPCGSVADITCFSFHPRKLICTGEGGAVTTDIPEWARWLDCKLAHGSVEGNGISREFVDFGYNFRLSEIQALLARKQLAGLDAMVDGRLKIIAQYLAELGRFGFAGQRSERNVRHNVQSATFKVPGEIDRDALIHQLRREGIHSTIGTYSLSATPYYRSRYNDVQPNAQSLQACTLTLPCYGGMPLERVVSAIDRFLR